jgi:glycine betaine/choline ABC-type transport system substrate-binding protein
MLGQMVRLVLEANGIATVDRTRIGATPVVRKALLTGEIDLYVEYTGNAGLFLMLPRIQPGAICRKGMRWPRGSTIRPTTSCG